MNKMIKSMRRFYKIYILLIDLALILLAYVLTFYVRYQGLPEYNFTPFLRSIPYILIASVLYIDMFKVLSFFRKSVYDVLKSIASTVALLGITTIAVAYMLQGFSFPRLILLITPVVQFVLLGAFNIFLLYVRNLLTKEKKIMVICDDKHSQDGIADKIRVFTKNDKIEKMMVLDLTQQKIIMRRLRYMDEVYISANIPAEFKAEIIKHCMGGRQVIYVVPHLFEISLINAKVMQLDDTPAFMVDTLGLRAEQAFVKRAFDIVISLIGIIVLSPLMLIITLLIRMTSKGPAFFKQERITKGNKSFYVIKFRTMKQDAEKKTGPVLSAENDPRITPIGRFLRRTRIDELPQLINVLKGDMSLVGPRPERPFFVEQFIHKLPEYEHRFVVKAGITGYAQIYGSYSTSPEDKLRYDLIYIRNYSLLLDIKLIFNTLRVIFSPGSTYRKNDELLGRKSLRNHSARKGVI